MHKLILAMIYTGLLLGANATAGMAVADVAAAKAAATGEMAKLIFAQTPKPLPELALLDGNGGAASLAPYAGSWMVLNFWATWCGPCRTEMPTLQNLQVLMPDVAVVPVATGRNAVEGIKSFYAKAGVTDLPLLRDPDSDLAHRMGVIGLPVTVIVNPEGAEIARLIGGAEWDSPEAQAVLKALMMN